MTRTRRASSRVAASTPARADATAAAVASLDELAAVLRVVQRYVEAGDLRGAWTWGREAGVIRLCSAVLAAVAAAVADVPPGDLDSHLPAVRRRLVDARQRAGSGASVATAALASLRRVAGGRPVDRIDTPERITADLRSALESVEWAKGAACDARFITDRHTKETDR